MLRATVRSVLAAAVIIALWPATGHGQRPAIRRGPFVEHFAARAVDPLDPAARSPVDIIIERWSTDADAQSLSTALSHGPDTLLPALQKMWHRVGFILTPGMQGLGPRSRDRWVQNIFFAREVKAADGVHVIVATDRQPMLMPPTKRSPRPFDFEFALIDMRIGADGKGVGKVASATDVAYNAAAKTIEIEKFASQPIRLADVTSAMR